VVNAVEKYRLAGIVATNTTIDKRGLPCRRKAA
jgi:dihydroorotate dehydrogenase